MLGAPRKLFKRRSPSATSLPRQHEHQGAARIKKSCSPVGGYFISPPDSQPVRGNTQPAWHRPDFKVQAQVANEGNRVDILQAPVHL